MNAPRESFGYWRVRIMYSTMIGYILFYFVRKNLSMAMPGIEADLGITKVQLGAFLTAHGILYGLSRFLNGILADRANPRLFMAAGLLVCAIANVGFGLSSAVWWMGAFWIVNAWFQGMGFPPCVKSLTQWYAPSERGVTMSLWNTSHSIGGGLIFLLNSWVVWYFADWRYCFFVPAALALLGVFFIWNRLRDSPESLGFPSIEAYEAQRLRSNCGFEKAPTQSAVAPQASGHRDTSPRAGDCPVGRSWRDSLSEWWAQLSGDIFTNPTVWALCSTMFFIYVVRFTILDWAPTFLKEAKGVELHHAGPISSAYELTGVLGMLSSGYLMDRVFHGRGARVCFFFMLGCTITLLLYWWIEPMSGWGNALFLAVIGFLIYGPQCLVGAIIANLVDRQVASAAIGLAGVFSYASVIVTGWGIGWLARDLGWNAVFMALIGAAGLGTLLFLSLFHVQPRRSQPTPAS